MSVLKQPREALLECSTLPDDLQQATQMSNSRIDHDTRCTMKWASVGPPTQAQLTDVPKSDLHKLLVSKDNVEC